MAKTFAQTLNKFFDKALKENENLIIIGEDIADPFGGAYKVTLGLSEKYHGRVLNTPISEASLTGIATGMALKGIKPVLEIMYSDFMTLCSDQIINHAAKFRWMYNDKVDVPLVVRTPTGSGNSYGPTHSQSLESLLFNVPGLNLISPSLFHNIESIYQAAIDATQPVIIFESKRIYYKELINEPEANHLKKEIIDKGFTQWAKICNDVHPEITILAYGGMCDLFYKEITQNKIYEQIGFEFLIPSQISPLDFKYLSNSIEKTRKLMIIEETPGYAGWSAEITATINQIFFNKLRHPVVRLSADNSPIGCAKWLEEQIIPQHKKMTDTILEMVD